MDDANRVGFVGVSPGPEHHGAQAQWADRDTGPAEDSVLHGPSNLSEMSTETTNPGCGLDGGPHRADWLWLDHYLECFAGVHGGVALRRVLDRNGPVEDLAWVDGAVEHAG